MEHKNFNPLEIKTKIFEGPFDLLLHLIRKKKLDIHTVSLAELCQPFLDYVKKIKKLQLDDLGQFLFIASSLIVIKARALLPQIRAENEEMEDTEESLRQQLLEYDSIRKKSDLLWKMEWLYRDIFPRASNSQELFHQNLDVEVSKENLEINIPDLFDSFQAILLASQNQEPEFSLPEFRINSQDIFKKILENFKARISFEIQELFALFLNLQEKIISFVLVLEICRLQWVRIEQKNYLGDIFFYPNQKFVNGSEQDLSFS